MERYADWSPDGNVLYFLSERDETKRQLAPEIELALDFVILEDGLCVGSDESGLFESVTEDVERQRKTAQEIVAALRNGASAGHVFEVLRPLARHPPQERRIGYQGRIPWRLLTMFADAAIHRLVHAGDSELLPWFERADVPIVGVFVARRVPEATPL